MPGRRRSSLPGSTPWEGDGGYHAIQPERGPGAINLIVSSAKNPGDHATRRGVAREGKCRCNHHPLPVDPIKHVRPSNRVHPSETRVQIPIAS